MRPHIKKYILDISQEQLQRFYKYEKRKIDNAISTHKKSKNHTVKEELYTKCVKLRHSWLDEGGAMTEIAFIPFYKLTIERNPHA